MAECACLCFRDLTPRVPHYRSSCGGIEAAFVSKVIASIMNETEARGGPCVVSYCRESGQRVNL